MPCPVTQAQLGFAEPNKATRDNSPSHVLYLRFFGGSTDCPRSLERVAKADAGFRSITENIDTTTPAGRMMM